MLLQRLRRLLKQKKRGSMMVVILKENPDSGRISDLTAWLESLGLEVHPTVGKVQTILGLVGDTSKVDIELIRALDIVQDVKRISQPYKEANRAFHPDNTVVTVGDASFGDGSCPIIAGPCSVESREQLLEVALRVKAAGATLLRGGAFKPRTSPYAFQGLHADGIKLLLEVKKETGLPIVTELMDLSQLDLFDAVSYTHLDVYKRQEQYRRQLADTLAPARPDERLCALLCDLEPWKRAVILLVFFGGAAADRLHCMVGRDPLETTRTLRGFFRQVRREKSLCRL